MADRYISDDVNIMGFSCIKKLMKFTVEEIMEEKVFIKPVN